MIASRMIMDAMVFWKSRAGDVLPLGFRIVYS